jgi:hypothetical protein
MSTILETLKKLEEDKRLLEKDSNLKELILKDDLNPFSRKPLAFAHKNFMAMCLVLAGIIIGLALVWGFQSPGKQEVVYSLQGRTEQKLPPLNKKWSEPAQGIPLSNIPEQRQFYEENISEKFPPAIEAFSPPPVPQFHEPIAGPEVLPQEINEIRDLIQSAKLKAQQPETYVFPVESAPHGISIPNLKVKGIIFFSPGSSSNHIFVSTLETSNHKVRVGDSVQSATLTHIAANRVVFSYQGENVHLRIGE